MITKITTINKLKEFYSELFLSITNNVTKISPGSTLNAHSFGVAKIAQKLQKDIAVLESQIFPDSATGEFLDSLASLIGVPPRFSETGSSTYLLLMGDVGTTYLQATHTFTGSHGIVFSLEGDITIPTQGFTYAKVNTASTGETTNVDSWSINQIIPSDPIGHSFVVNEYKAMGGRDVESDDTFRRRIKESVNLLATGTLSKYEQSMIKNNNNVLRAFKGGFNTDGQLIIYVASMSGGAFSSSDLSDLEEAIFVDLSFTDQEQGIDLQNVTFKPIDVSMRIDISTNFLVEDVRKEMQIRMQRSLDYRYWDETKDRIEWDDLLVIAKRTRGVRVLLDNFFTPNSDISIVSGELPRIRSFSIYDLDGVLLDSSTGDTPTNFPNQSNYILQQTLIS